ncbi:hypothetical protein [Fuerstiella marisgermanici]|nr:hypothetical protein [Fuerstiella marisgermanici]
MQRQIPSKKNASNFMLDPPSETETLATDADQTIAQPADGAASWAVSLCFWFALLVSASVYAVVALAPKFAVWNRVRHEYRLNAERMIALEDDVDYLERVEVALKTDPEFVQRLAGLSKPKVSDNEEFIPVSGNLLFGYTADEAVDRPNTPNQPPYHGFIMSLATRSGLRTGLLSFSACLIVFAFTFFNDAGSNLVHSAGRLMKATALLPVRRYMQQPTEPTADAADSTVDET